MKLGRKGQALVEFVLVLPIIIIILFCMIDFGRILIVKNELENKTSEIVSLYKKESISFNEIESMIQEDLSYKINMDSNKEEKYTNIIVTANLKLITPGASLILDNPYKISVKKVIPNE